MQFPTQFPFLVIPTGAGPGQQRITINFGNDGKIKVYDQNGNLVDAIGGPQGQIILYDSTGNMVISLASAAGTDDRTGLPFQQGITTYTATTAINFFGNDGTWTASDGSKVVVESGAGATVFFTPSGGPWFAGTVHASSTLLSGGHPALSINSPTDTTNGINSDIILGGSSTGSTATQIQAFATNIHLLGIVDFNNIAFGSVTITPSAANTPTSAAISFGPLSGTVRAGFATANTTVPGTQVTGVSMTSLTTSSANVWLTRTNTTATIVWWLVLCS